MCHVSNFLLKYFHEWLNICEIKDMCKYKIKKCYIGTCSEKAGLLLKCHALQAICQKSNCAPPFVAKSIRTPSNSEHVRHEEMLGI